MERENWRKLSTGEYLVRTQAGFKHALRHYMAAQWMNDHYAEQLEGYPKKYPSICRFSDSVDTAQFWVTCIPINEHRQQLHARIDELEGD